MPPLNRFRLLTLHAALFGLSTAMAGGFAGAYLLKLGFSLPVALAAYGVLLVLRFGLRGLAIAIVRRVGMAGALRLGVLIGAVEFLPLLMAGSLAGLLAFMTQVALVLLLGYTLATTRPVARALVRIASIPKTPRAAYAFVALVASVASLISFGLGLVVGGVIALEVGRAARRRGVRLHYPLLVASAYSGFAVWHMGYSATGPLAAATTTVSPCAGLPISCRPA